MQRTNIRIRGRVQGVGMRVRIKAAADEIGVRGTVENLDDGSVLVVCEAEQTKIENLVQQIRDHAEPAAITDILVEGGSPATGLGGFKIKFGDTNTEMLTAVFIGTEALRRIDKKQDKMLDKQDKMLEAQKEMNATMKSVDGKMDLSLENDTEILKVLRSMRGGDMLRIAG
ncbi:MAG: acylphosphatase [Thaumarchaeota archaeon]|nr:acylphosphatase [Nitrososphaerota archaeon]